MSKNNDLDLNTPSMLGVRVGKLDTIQDIRSEMGKLYRAARKTAGPSPDAQTASKLAFILQHISKSLEGVELERRIEQLENKLLDANQES